MEIKPSILIIGHIPPPAEGTAKLTELLVRSLYLQEKFNIHFLALMKRDTATKRGKLGWVNIAQNTANVINFIGLILKHRIKVIYLPMAQNTLGFTRDSIFILLGHLFSKKVCVHFHGGNFDKFYINQNRLFQIYIKYVLGKIDSLILLAQKFKMQFEGFVDAGKINTVYNCLPEYSLPDTSHALTKGKDIVNILYFGYLSKAKGALDVAEAIPLVLLKYRGGKSIKFTLCGYPVEIERNITFIPEPHFAYSKILKIISGKKLENVVTVKTRATSLEKKELFMKADIFVFPTYSEGCGIVALEAMSYGLPVITTRVGALDEMLVSGNNCIFVDPGSIDKLADAILLLANDHERSQVMGKNNIKLLESDYCPNVFINDIAKVWLSIL